MSWSTFGFEDQHFSRRFGRNQNNRQTQPSQGWVFTEGHPRYILQPYNQDKWWKHAYPKTGVAIYYTYKNEVDAEYTGLQVVDHYGETLNFPFTIVTHALQEAGPKVHAQIEFALTEIEKNQRIALTIIHYLYRHALMCYPMEETI